MHEAFCNILLDFDWIYFNQSNRFAIMARKSTARKTTKKPARKLRKRKAAPKRRKTRTRRKTKSTQVTGPEIDKVYNDLLEKTVLERKIEEKAAADEEEHPNLLISTNYEEHSPFDPDEDIDDEPGNRSKMYEIPPKARSPERGNSAANDPVQDNNNMSEPQPQDEPTKSANREYEYYFN